MHTLGRRYALVAVAATLAAAAAVVVVRGAGGGDGTTEASWAPGELTITAADYPRWFAEMGRLGIRAVRIYTIHPPVGVAPGMLQKNLPWTAGASRSLSVLWTPSGSHSTPTIQPAGRGHVGPPVPAGAPRARATPGERDPVATTLPVPRIGLRVVSPIDGTAGAELAWDGWNVVHPTERLKAGVEAYADTLRDVSAPPAPR